MGNGTNPHYNIIIIDNLWHTVMAADPLGRAMYDCHRGELIGELVYRDGDDIEPHDVHATYFTPPESWSAEWQRQLAGLDGPVLDIGCGPGNNGLWLQGQGREVVGIDVSSNAVKAARGRGLEEVRVMDMFDLGFPRDRFQSAIAIGTQLGLAGSLPGVRAFLSDLAFVTDERAVAIVDNYDPAGLDPETFLGYRPDPRPGVARRAFHFEYRQPSANQDAREVGRTLTFVLFGPDRLRDIVIGTPWELAAVHPRDGYYRARLEK